MVSPDKVCVKYSRKKVKLVCKNLNKNTILFEGNKNALEFLGELFISQANAIDSGFSISPDGAGKIFFDAKSTKGICIHRLPSVQKSRFEKSIYVQT